MDASLVNQVDTLQHITTVLSVIAFFLTISVVITWAMFPKVRSNILFMVLMLSIIGVIFSINHVMGVFAVNSALIAATMNDSFCIFQGWLSSCIELAEAIWTSCMATHILIVVHWPEKIKFKTECLIFGAISFGPPMLIASFAAGFNLYGVSQPHISCHFRSDEWDFGLHYSVIIFCGLYDIVLLIYYYWTVVPELRARERILAGGSSKDSKSVDLPSKRADIASQVGRILSMYDDIYVVSATFLYVIAYLCVWGPPALYRTYRIITGRKVAWLRYMYTFFHNSLPIVDTVIYAAQNKVVRRVWKESFNKNIWNKKNKSETEEPEAVVAEIIVEEPEMIEIEQREVEMIEIHQEDSSSSVEIVEV